MGPKQFSEISLSSLDSVSSNFSINLYYGMHYNVYFNFVNINFTQNYCSNHALLSLFLARGHLKGLAQAKIIKKSVILFRVFNMPI